MKALGYVWAAFNARALGMPVPLNWFGLAAFGMLGALLNPGFWALGAGLELGYLALLSGNARFRRGVDARRLPADSSGARYENMLGQLDDGQRQRQQRIEGRAREVLQLLSRSPLMASHASSLEQLVWLHLRLLVAGQALTVVVDTASRESAELQRQEDQIDRRLGASDLGADLRRSLEQQKQVIDARQAAHVEGLRRKEHVDAELQRIDQQVALIREQALLATDEEQIGIALNALTSSFTEASSWLNSQRDLIGVLEVNEQHSLPRYVLQGQGKRTATADSA
ncbi:hypothetical protein [Phytopseudomonas dryadis]|uniref:Uncharacterized protein n=1 Tax=Phytopseudomonas dryadis TaxID=2487520 RepID=A0ABY1Z2I0_9GAMM|nr:MULTISPECIES: hypothetical protein [Pseudomonas]TBV02472.1 hypothetical protein DNK34_19030 [Pseudomonas dryadis]TBV12705.1 hypothetical protein DNK41_24090 [Pseudomonas sp. FRB 230]